MKTATILGFVGAMLAGIVPGVAMAQAQTMLPVPDYIVTERSSPPDICSERTVNCVIDDGPPPRAPWVHRVPAIGVATGVPSAPPPSPTVTAPGTLLIPRATIGPGAR
jgi:hypothetical protein